MSFRKQLYEIISTVIFALILAIILRNYVIEARVIPSGSMLPTIQLQDRVLVNKFIYRFTEPKRGDIIVFKPPVETPQKEEFIKRVIGLPGETIEIKKGTVYINNKPLEEPYIREKPNYHYGPVKIPDDAFFVMGDNRNASFDSHLWGDNWLKSSMIKGKAFVKYWPLYRIGLLH